MADWSTIAAWWGAGTGTLAIVFEVYKYARSGPRLHVRAAADVETVEASGTLGGRKDFMRFRIDVGLRVANRGDTTTITDVVAIHYKSAAHRLLRWSSKPLESHSYSSPDGLPFALEQGHEWSGSINQRDLLKVYGERGHFLIGVSSTDRETPALRRVRLSEASARSRAKE